MRKLNVFLAIIFLISTFQTSYGQSCGGGTSTFHVYDENGFIEVTDFYINLHIVSEDQGWKVKDFSKYGWKRQIFSEETHKKYKNSKESLKTAFEIPPNEQSRLIQNWIKLAKKYPNDIYAKNKDHCGNWLQESTDTRKKPFSVCTREGCSWMVLLEIQAKGYETAYYVSDFLCGCTKHYEFRLKQKRDRCLPKCSVRSSPF
ncbi:MAG: hypothetical protein AAB336_04850 [Acidobacteriota bacterium]